MRRQPEPLKERIHSGLQRIAGKYTAFLLTMAPACLSAQTTVVPLHPGGIQTNEPSIAIHPSNPDVRILGANTSYFFQSTNGGLTWQPAVVQPPEGFYGDPVVRIGKNGSYYLLHLAKNKSLPYPESFDRIVFEKSTDRGMNWKSTGIGLRPGKMQDKPWMSLDEIKSSRYNGSIYVSWTEFDKYGSANPEDSSRIRFAYSRDGGDSFTCLTVSDTSGDARDGDNTLEGATTAVGKSGEVYMVWAGRGKIWFDKSSDGGKTWGKDQVIETQHGSWNTEDVENVMRSNSMPFVTTDLKGWIYVVFGDSRRGDQDIFLIMSKDAGKTWTAAQPLNTDLTKGRDQYMPAICTDPSNGKVYVTWYDRRHSDNNLYTDVYLRPVVKGKPGKEYRVSNTSFCPPGKLVFFGDYIGIAAARGQLAAAYTVFDHDKLVPTVYVALMTDKSIRKQAGAVRPPYMQVAQLGDTALLSVHFSLPGYKSATLEIKRGRQVYYKQLFDPLPASEQEVLLPLSRFTTGVYAVTLSFKGRKLDKDLYIEVK